MRLIDADQLKMQIAAAVADKGAESAHKAVMLACVIDNQPTIEAVPVVHGEWIYENYTWHCGVCGFHPFKGYIPKEPGFNFCPNCRAKMDGGSDQ